MSLQAELRGVERCMRYCRILRERQAATQAAILQTMGVTSEDIYVQVQTLSRHHFGVQTAGGVSCMRPMIAGVLICVTNCWA